MKDSPVKDGNDVNSLMREILSQVLEGSLAGELEDDLGYSKYDSSSKFTDNSRNGHSAKTVHTSYGDVDIDVPRDRFGEFEPKILKKHQTALTKDMEAKIISMYSKGMSTSDIEDHIRDLYGVDISDTTISRITYTAPNEETALFELDSFEEKWKSKYPKISISWRNNWPDLSTYFKYPQRVRTLIYTTNAIEGFNRQLKKVTKSKTVFPTDDSLLKMMYLAMKDITKKWTQSRRDWGHIHSQLEIYFEDRI